jgi:hypothetical protein
VRAEGIYSCTVIRESAVPCIVLLFIDFDGSVVAQLEEA